MHTWISHWYSIHLCFPSPKTNMLTGDWRHRFFHCYKRVNPNSLPTAPEIVRTKKNIAWESHNHSCT